MVSVIFKIRLVPTSSNFGHHASWNQLWIKKLRLHDIVFFCFVKKLRNRDFRVEKKWHRPESLEKLWTLIRVWSVSCSNSSSWFDFCPSHIETQHSTFQINGNSRMLFLFGWMWGPHFVWALWLFSKHIARETLSAGGGGMNAIVKTEKGWSGQNLLGVWLYMIEWFLMHTLSNPLASPTPFCRLQRLEKAR